MLYEVRTYTLRPGPWPNLKSALPSAAPAGKTLQIGGLLAHRVRSAQSGHPRLSLRRPPPAHLRTRSDGARHRSGAAPRRCGPDRGDGIRDHEPGAVYAPLGSRDYGTGNVYEMRTYTYAPGDIPKCSKRGQGGSCSRGALPLAACWTSELGGLNKFVHTWVYKDWASAPASARNPVSPAARGRRRAGAAGPAGKQAADRTAFSPVR